MTRRSHEALEKLPFFAGWTKDELTAVDKVADEVTFAPGELLMKQGNVAYEFIVIIDGTVGIEHDGEQIASLGPGEHVGEMALLDGGVRSATVVARTEVKALLVGSREFRALVAKLPSLDRQLLKSLTRRLRSE